MGQLSVKRFTAADERRPFVERGYADILDFDSGVVGQAVFEPGWRWSSHVKPIAGTESCQSSHACYVVSGRLHVVMDNGEEADLEPGDVAMIPPGHDAWTVGAEPCVSLDFAGMEHYAQKQPEKPREAEAEAAAPTTH
jgi:quercetin dioxygenase-like cupin family protein